MADEKSFLIVNPKGAMHVVSEDHARARLRIAGWHLATAEEKDAYAQANGNQRFDRPLGKRFEPDKQLADALPMEEAITTKADVPESIQDIVAPVAKAKRRN